MTNEQAEIFVGIDVSKKRLDIGIHGQTEVTQENNDEPGIGQVVKQVGQLHFLSKAIAQPGYKKCTY